MKQPFLLWLLILTLPFCFSSCCSTYQLTDQAGTFSPTAPTPQLASSLLPYFYVRAATKEYNKIGTPEIVAEKGQPTARVNSETATLYFETSRFETPENKYTNLVYRIHFQKVPFGLCSLNLTAGNNPGLLIIYTLDQESDLVLITTVHTCGCYLAFFPTSKLSEKTYPANWPPKNQSVFGYTLPSKLEGLPYKPYYFTIEDGTHRISAISQNPPGSLDTLAPPLYFQMDTQPMEHLHKLPYQNELVSFFEEAGSRKGYVKNNRKILERLLISWWALDWHVGEDKAYGNSDTTQLPFYTSLKFWQRKNSDLKDFPGFLHYWGWKL
ncbi:hypothetical protein [Desulforhopalus sp. IMCC35007]|uniref:hypothetical protein n=1 Tax=Desulforhopalus sp. IMCC35007 TaxID=2569543 RepID=UPI0010AEAEF9|nr:hypothetical protein [Desulforhopalus sp. IMCC35007]TKB06930.1 hypothetical protein FCL48_19245 [Desulforhopalus sp. IMCC35007]